FHLLVNVESDLVDERGAAGLWDRGWTAGAEVSVVKRAGGYDLELALPWQQLGVTPGDATRLGLDLAVNDTDAAGQLTPADWAGLTRFAQPDKWGSVVLGGVGCDALPVATVEEPPPPSTPAEPEAAAPVPAAPDNRYTSTPVGCTSGAGEAMPAAMLGFFSLVAAVSARRRATGVVRAPGR
ncbi:MAG: sugar-binding protein, partial [Myxococcaceae bacterium]